MRSQDCKILESIRAGLLYKEIKALHKCNNADIARIKKINGIPVTKRITLAKRARIIADGSSLKDAAINHNVSRATIWRIKNNK